MFPQPGGPPLVYGSDRGAWLLVLCVFGFGLLFNRFAHSAGPGFLSRFSPLLGVVLSRFVLSCLVFAVL